MPDPCITLLSDFGRRDPYVGIMKGVILGICPGVHLVDLTHEVVPQDVEEGAFQLASAAPWFPDGTIHLAVVDPGVGSQRRAVAARGRRFAYVGPDNGVLSLAWAQDEPVQVREIQPGPYTLKTLSRTFHGRDVFAPATAHLARGVALDELGPPVLDPVRLELAEHPRVVHVDGFGNLITSVKREGTPPFQEVQVGWRSAPLRETFSGVAPGELVAYWGSLGLLEVAINGGNAAAELGAERGWDVRLRG
ncbi:MAG: SAM-dependent chlorinase/fluorinase [Candidatus Eremiobacterota bacterium]